MALAWGETGYNGSIKNTQEKGGYDHETEKIPCPRPRGRDDRSDPHRLRTAGGPLRLVLWRRRQRLPGQRKEPCDGVRGA